jgi:hypothetical protein
MAAKVIIEHATKPATVNSPPQAAKPVPAPAVKTPELELQAAPAPVAVAASPASDGDTQRFHVARGIQLPEIDLELEPEPAKPVVTTQQQPVTKAAAPVPAAAPARAQAPIASPAVKPQAAATPKPTPAVAAKASPKVEAAKTTAPVAKAQPFVAPAMPAGAPKIVDDYIPVLDTTMTVRALTQAERDDANQPTWFAVQLALSDQPVNLDTMPKLDIFSAYRLYSVALMDGGKIQHALRLGFFKESVSAEAVSGYLKTFFDATTITRIAKAEYERFAEPKPMPKPAPAGNVVKLEEKRTSPTPPTQAAARATPRPATLTAPRAPSKGTGNNKLANDLREEARKIKLSESGIQPSPRPQSFFSRLIGRNLD